MIRITPMLSRAAVVAIAATLVTAQAAFAWTQLYNNYPLSPESCNGSANYPCIRWPKTSSGWSITVKVYLDSSLTTANINLKTDMRNGMEQWNGAPARNPFYVEEGTVWPVSAYRDTPFNTNAWAEAAVFANSSNKITSATIRFNPLVTWNRNFTYSTFQADARKVATHEIGHTQALGHTGKFAVMRQGDIDVWRPQSNDIDGMQAIYGPA